MYEVMQVKARSENYEDVGGKPKFWFTDESFPTGAMFKHKRHGTGEDWSEKVACELCRTIGLPHAEYHLATCVGGPSEFHPDGTLSPNFSPKLGRLVLGNEFLGRMAKTTTPERRFHSNRNTLRAIETVMRLPMIDIPDHPASLPALVETALDVLIGYLVLDAWISNQDRHNQNWGVIVYPTRKVRLAPTFDHASSLGRNESDSFRKHRLTTKDRGASVERYVARARSAIFANETDAKALKTLDVCKMAGEMRPRAFCAWVERIAGIGREKPKEILANIPNDRISDAGRDFALAILGANRRRLLDLRTAMT